MKYCPSCQTEYADDSLRFCLQDGAGLLRYPVKNSQMKTQDLGETETVIRQKPITTEWEQSRITRVSGIQREVKNPNPLLIGFLTALGMCVLLGGIAGIWLMLSGSGSEYANLSNINAGINVGNSSSRTKTNTNIAERTKGNKTNSGTNKVPGWEPINYQASLNGENLTYYRGTTAAQCQADCAANPKCAAFTLIRAGAYNTGDPPMCYLVVKVTGVVTHSCCISGIKSKNANSSADFKACNYQLGSDLYNKWKQMGGESGSLGCPIMNEAEVAPSPQGTTGRYTQFSKGDGGYIIRHESGRFSGTAFEVSGCMFKLYSSIGGTGSWLGFPIKDGYKTSAGARQDFEEGYILWDSKTSECRAYRN